MKCKHKDKNGNSTIINGVCEICGEEFTETFLRKIRDKSKIRKKGGHNKW